MATATNGSMLRHEAWLYRGRQEYVTVLGGFIADSLATGHPVMVAAPPRQCAWLEEHLHADAARIDMVDMAELGRNPARIIPAIRTYVDGHADQSAVFIGEPIWPDRRPAEAVEACRHEALINLAFAEDDLTVVCPYDARLLSAQVLADAGRTHPALRDGTRARRSNTYADPIDLWRTAGALPPPPAHARTYAFGRHDLATVRWRVQVAAAAAGLPEEREDDLILAVSEAATNSVCHGGGAGILRIWTQPGSLICQVDDRGQLGDPLAGRRSPVRAPEAGWGLWLANRSVDLLQLHTHADGTSVRLHMDR